MAAARSAIEELARAARCEARGDDLTRQLYATDASLYQVVPAGVAFPKSAAETASAVRAAAAAGLSVTARGAGSGLAGGALGEGLVVDLARHNRRITGFDPEARTVRVEVGVVLDQLNDFLQPHGLVFGPDVATSSRATVGGMLGNNSSGARAPLYGTTIDHTESVEVVLADGTVAELGPESPALRGMLSGVDPKIRAAAGLVRERFHRRICKRWPGYGLDRYLPGLEDGGGDLSKLIGGSEGTLGLVFAATLRVVPLPPGKGVGLLFFDSAADAFDASVALMPLKPAAVEHIDDALFDQTRGQRAFQAARDLLELDTKPCRSILIVEFYGDERDKLAEMARLGLGTRRHLCADAREMALVWHLRKAGLSLLTGRPGAAKPVPGIEDVCVPPARLPEYTAALRALFDRFGVEGSFYGHAGSGLLHVRPVLDLHRAAGVAAYRGIGEEVAAICRHFDGSLAAEHGVGIARTEFVEGQVGPELLGLMREIKTAFDPGNLLNPGKIFDDGTFRFDTRLRQGAGAAIPVPFEPVLAYAAKDKSFTGNLEQCNGCGGCRKDAPTMCPTFQATGEELMSTRGRANIIRAVLEGRIKSPQGPLLSEALEQAISNCLSCRACAGECPSNVNLPLLKAELLHARHRRHGTPLAARLFSRVDRLGALGSLMPGAANALQQWPPLRRALRAVAGVSARRPLPKFADFRFDRWFARRPAPAGASPRGKVILWDDCFVRHYEPGIGRAAVRVLEAAGFTVELPKGRACCGRPAFSMGCLDTARAFGRQNIALLRGGTEPVIFLEPSCFTMFKEDYRELGLDGAEALAARAVLFEDFIAELLAREPEALRFNGAPARAAVHTHCHARAAADPAVMLRVAGRIPGAAAELLDTGCCGMAGAFGAMEEKYDLSVKVAGPLVAKVNALSPETDLIASGTSCRHQITHLTLRQPQHFAEWIADRLA
ncbi:MAG: FAD-binding protein [Candidatus Hydrogenedens sp.]|nr:FAD-binding protein [Candidatus Hydrogenedentota bacterium]NLF58375.1 FAD-binding protein [Candidatus Hydrogenedens sp.]